jgi:hypothetical protein
MLVIIDNCVTDLLADAGANPACDLRNTEFRLVYTPDLQFEYENALAHTSTAEATKNIIREILNEGSLYGFCGFDGGPFLGLDQGILAEPDQLQTMSVDVQANKRGLPRKRTDVHLAALAKGLIVITNNNKEGLWRRAPSGDGIVIQWTDFRHHWVREGNLAVALRALIQERYGSE